MFRFDRLFRFFDEIRAGFLQTGGKPSLSLFHFSYPSKEEQEEQEEHQWKFKHLRSS